MEIELKLGIPDKQEANLIWEDEYLAKYEEEDTREVIPMISVYFDTQDKILSKNDIAFRVRKEGQRIVAALKWNGDANDGLHKREEINIPLTDLQSLENPNPEIFKESEVGREVLLIIGDKKLIPVLRMEYLRRCFRIDYYDAIIEISIDDGEVITDSGNLEILELELELFSGNQEALKKLGDQMQSKHRLFLMDESKYSRGIKILNKI